MLSESLRAVLCQYLLPRADAPGRCLASELMLRNDAVANLIRRDQSFQLSSLIATSSEQGMHSMDQDLMRLLKLGAITPEDAYLKARHKKDFEAYMEDDSLLRGGEEVEAAAQSDKTRSRAGSTTASGAGRRSKPTTPGS